MGWLTCPFFRVSSSCSCRFSCFFFCTSVSLALSPTYITVYSLVQWIWITCRWWRRTRFRRVRPCADVSWQGRGRSVRVRREGWDREHAHGRVGVGAVAFGRRARTCMRPTRRVSVEEGKGACVMRQQHTTYVRARTGSRADASDFGNQVEIRWMDRIGPPCTLVQGMHVRVMPCSLLRVLGHVPADVRPLDARPFGVRRARICRRQTRRVSV